MDNITYAAAGVDTQAGERAVELMKASIRKTHNASVIGDIGGFSGLYDLSLAQRYRRPLLASSTDGVGTKVAIAQALDIHHTIGFDLVGMVVDDIAVVGAEPLYMTDYIACGQVIPERIATIVRGIAQACQHSGTALVGGETAEHPGLLGPLEYDIAGAATGIVDAHQVLGPERVCSGDIVIALASSGLHANGYSLVRHILMQNHTALEEHFDELGQTLGEELLTPTRIYTPDCLAMARTFGVSAQAGVHALSHITGGGMVANLARVLPPGMTALVDRSTWSIPPIFNILRALGKIQESEMDATFNMGIGFVALVSPSIVDAVLTQLTQRGVKAWVLGEVVPANESPRIASKGVLGGSVRFVGKPR